jgi:hypothetical protein
VSACSAGAAAGKQASAPRVALARTTIVPVPRHIGGTVHVHMSPEGADGMRYETLIATSAVAMSLGFTAAGDMLYQVEVAEEQGEGFVPSSDSQYHPNPVQLYADDFTLDEDVTLTSIAWFGYSDYWDFPDLTNFTLWEVHLYVGQGELVEPGERIFEAVYDKEDTNPQELGPQGLFGSTLYRHEVQLDEPVQLEAGQQYWLAVGADAVDPSGDWWLWAQAPPNDETVATWKYNDEVWELRPPDWNPDWPTYNVAFELFGDVGGGLLGDLDDDGLVAVSDLLILLADWGDCADPDDCPADLDGDGTVAVSDLLTLLANWS